MQSNKMTSSTYSMTLGTSAVHESVLVMANIASLMVNKPLEGSSTAT